jgi:cell division protein FtsW (lipid II flippase)
MTRPVTKTQVVLAQLAVWLIVAFLFAGLLLYGLSTETLSRMWRNLVERPEGPMLFRFFLQPTMAAIVAWRDGMADARLRRQPFLVTAVVDPTQRRTLLNEAVRATSRIILLGLVMDIIYQAIQFKTFHPAEAAVIALTLAFLPYVLVRGLVARGARRWMGIGPAGERQ